MARTFAAFDPKRELLAARRQTVHGEELVKGDPYPKDKKGEDVIPEGTRRRLWMTHWADYKEDARPTPVAKEVEPGPGEEPPLEGPAALVGMAHKGGGNYVISAPWLEEPEKVRGKADAEARLQEVRDAGPPEGWSEGEADSPEDPPGEGETAGDDAGE